MKAKAKLVCALLSFVIICVTERQLPYQLAAGELGQRQLRGGVTPLGIEVSRILYWRSQTDWHYGLTPVGSRVQNGMAMLLSKPSRPPWSDWLDQLSQDMRPPQSFAHEQGSTQLEHQRNSAVVLLMNLALQLDPIGSRIYREKAFIEDQQEGASLKAEQTLLQGLCKIENPRERVGLLIDLIFLRNYRLRNLSGLQTLVSRLKCTVKKAGPDLSNETLMEVKACERIMDLLSSSQNIEGKNS